MGSARLLLGDARRAIPFFLDAERLSPFDLYRFHNLGELAAAYCFVEDWPSAAKAADRALNLSPGYFYARFLKIGALMRAGRHEDASREKAIFQARHPGFLRGAHPLDPVRRQGGERVPDRQLRGRESIAAAPEIRCVPSRT